MQAPRPARGARPLYVMRAASRRDSCRIAARKAAGIATRMRGERLLLGGRQLLDDGLGDVVHGEPAVHGRLLDPAERLGLRQAHLLVEQALGAVDELAGLEPLDHVGDLGLEGHDLRVPGEGDLDRGQQVVRGEGLDDVRERAGLAGLLDELLLAERREEHDGGDVVAREPLRRLDAVELRHPNVHHDEVGAQLRGELDGRLTVTRFADDVESVVAQDLDDVEPDEGLVLRDDHAARSYGCVLSHPWSLGYSAAAAFAGAACAGVAEWQTRGTQNALSRDVWVRVPPPVRMRDRPKGGPSFV